MSGVNTEDEEVTSKSDFADEKFSDDELQTFGSLLKRLRAFEQAAARNARAVSHSMLKYDTDIQQIAQRANHLIDSNNNRKTQIQALNAKINEIETSVEQWQIETTQSEVEQKQVNDELRNNIGIVANDLAQTKQGFTDQYNQLEVQIGNISRQITEIIDRLHADGLMTVEVMTADPFAAAASHIPKYDGNPTQSFSLFEEQFKDTLGLITTALTETQKLNRLKYCLTGRARQEFSQLTVTTLEDALTQLKNKFQNQSTRTIAKQALSSCRQAPGEKVFNFANRLNEAVRAALIGEEENNIQKRLFDEFTDKLLPEIKFHVKAQMPENYTKAYELAENFELILIDAHVNVAQLIENVNSLHVSERGNNRPKKCYSCGYTGHFARDCRKKRTQFSQTKYRYQSNYRQNRFDQSKNRESIYRREMSPHRSVSKERSHSREVPNRSKSPRPRVHFREKARVDIITALCLFAVLINTALGEGTLLHSPMLCLPQAPAVLWQLPSDPICPNSNWIRDDPRPVTINVYRRNTIKYKTSATICKCIETKIEYWRGLLGGRYERTKITQIDVPSTTCIRMRLMNHSPVGELTNYTNFRGTNHSTEVEWNWWPRGILNECRKVLYCFVHNTVVYTRFAINGIHTPSGNCAGCKYEEGRCRCEHGTLLWKPDESHACPFVKLKNWNGYYANPIWLADAQDFALSFINTTSQSSCNNKMIIADQGYAIPVGDYVMLSSLKSNASRQKRNEYDRIGVVYSSQLASQLTALSVKMHRTTVNLFTNAVHGLCRTLENIANEINTLAKANPTLLIRHLTNNPRTVARLVTDTLMEVKPCVQIQANEFHLNKQNRCFDKLPINFILYGTLHSGFLDPVTSIIYPDAEEMPCETHKHIYIFEKNGYLRQYDQTTGDMKYIEKDQIQKLSRHGSFDFPEGHLMPTIFANKVLANLSELYSEHFQETIEAAEINQQILLLARTPDTWSEDHSERVAKMATNIVSNGLYGFLRGKMVSAVQVWTFACCCYVTLNAVGQYILPPIFLKILQYINMASLIWDSGQKITKFVQTRRKPKNARRRAISNNPTELKDRWPSTQEAVELVAIFTKRQRRGSFIIEGKLNGKNAKILIDTGAGISCIGPNTARKYNIEAIFPPDVNCIRGVGKERYMPYGVATVDIEINNNIPSTTHVFKEEIAGCGTNYDIIIGDETFIDFTFLIDSQTRQLVCKQIRDNFVCTMKNPIRNLI